MIFFKIFFMIFFNIFFNDILLNVQMGRNVRQAVNWSWQKFQNVGKNFKDKSVSGASANLC